MIHRLGQALRTARLHPARPLLVLVGLALLGWGAAIAYRHHDARRHWQLAQLALERDDLGLAQQHLDACLAVWNGRADVLTLAAQTARRREDFDHADACLTAAERLSPNSDAIAMERQLLIAQQGEPGMVRAHLESIAKGRPDQAVPVFEALGKGYFNSFARTDAVKCFNILLNLKPDHARALWWRGKAYDSLERHDLALADYRRAVELAPTLDEARLSLGQLLYGLGKSWEAIPQFECLRARRFKPADVFLGLARCRLDLYQRDEARQLLQALLADQPDHADALLELGRLEFHAGRSKEAETWLRRAAAAAPNDHGTHRALLLSVQAQGKDAEARSCQSQLDEIDGKLRQLRELIEKTRGDRRDARLRFEIGESLRSMGRMDEALSYYYAALGDDPDFAPARAALADHWQRVGQQFRADRLRKASGI